MRIHIAVPRLAIVGSQSAEIPVGHIHEIIVGHVGTYRRALHQPVGIHIHNAATDHPVQVRTVAVKIDVDFRAIDIRHAALVVEIIVVVGKIGLAKILLGIVNDELEFPSGRIMQFFLNVSDNLRGLKIDILRQRLACGIKINIILLRAHELPVEILVLHAVFPEADLRAIIELGIGF